MHSVKLILVVSAIERFVLLCAGFVNYRGIKGSGPFVVYFHLSLRKNRGKLLRLTAFFLRLCVMSSIKHLYYISKISTKSCAKGPDPFTSLDIPSINKPLRASISMDGERMVIKNTGAALFTVSVRSNFSTVY